MNETVYLAGQITGLTYGDAMQWRDMAIEELTEMGYDVFSPMRHKRNLAGRFDEETLPHHHETFRDPFERDILDIARSDFMIVFQYDGSVGTLIEMGEAHARGVHVILVDPVRATEGWEEAIHPFVKGVANDLVATLDEAYTLLSEYRPVKGA